MKDQKGYIDIDFGALFFTLIVVGIAIGIPITLFIQWIWPIAKSWLHTITG